MESCEWKPKVEISPNCPRCGSCNTKFCYYNNYSLTQPRYFCKGCRRYWTKGGSLRNVPVGGGCRKNRRGNKTFRQSSMGSLTPKISAHGDNCNNPTTNPPSSGVSDAPSIDLALVYANFLNQKPDPRAASSDHDQLGVRGCLAESQLMSESDQMCLYGIDQRCSSTGSHEGVVNFELPPLPGEEEALHDMMWSNNSGFPPSQLPVFGADDDADFLLDNWSNFHLSRP